MRNRGGFSLVETIVALVLLQFGMLALATGAAVAARELAAARRVTVALAMARNRVDALASLSCPAPHASVLEGNGFVEHWRVDHRDGRLLISDSVVFARPGGVPGFVVARRTTLCRP